MAATVKTARVEASPERVWSYLSVPEHWAEWDPDIARVLGGEGGLVDGGTLRIIMVQGLRGEIVFGEVQPYRRVVWRGRLLAGAMKTHAVFELEPLDGGAATQFTYQFEMVGAFGPIVRRLTHRSVARGVEQGIANIAHSAARWNSN